METRRLGRVTSQRRPKALRHYRMTLPILLRVTAIVLGVLALAAPAALAGGDDLPDPDLAAVRRLAQRVGPEKSYASSLPLHRRECRETAAPYLASGLPDRMAWGERVLIECYAAMLIKLADVYYESKTFGPGGMRALLNRLRQDLELLYTGIYQGRIHCVDECGPMDAVAALTAQRRTLEGAAWTMGSTNVATPDLDRWYDAWPRGSVE